MTTSLYDQIKTLKELQNLDTQVFNLRAEADLIPETRIENEEAFESKKIDLEEAKSKLKATQVETHQLENEVITRETLIAKLQNQQMQVKTNQEYSAIAHEINNALADKSVTEDQVLRLLDTIEDQKKIVEEEKVKLTMVEAEYNKVVAALDAREKEIQDSFDKLGEDRKQYLHLVEPELLEQYNNILQKRDGVALVPLEGGSCGGCGMNLPPQVVNLVKLKEDVTFCESCSRILYEV